jgi:hypothetical protein
MNISSGKEKICQILKPSNNSKHIIKGASCVKCERDVGVRNMYRVRYRSQHVYLYYK